MALRTKKNSSQTKPNPQWPKKNTKQNPNKMKTISLVQIFMALVVYINIKLWGNKTCWLDLHYVPL